MKYWIVDFFPNPGQHHSPKDFLAGLSKAEAAAVWHNLDAMGKIQFPKEWPGVKPVQKMYQLTSGAIRVYFQLDDRKIVVTHICRKVKDKAKENDLYRAQENYRKYLEMKRTK